MIPNHILKNIADKFDKIGAPVIFKESDRFSVNVTTTKNNEIFIVNIPEHVETLSVMDADKDDKHLLLLYRDRNSRFAEKDATIFNNIKVLCGHDERHYFSANVPTDVRTSSIRDAKLALLPKEFVKKQRRVRPQHMFKRNTEIGKRQGEWIFIKDEDFIPEDESLILKNEPISRGRGSKPHICEYLYRIGGRTVYVNDIHAPNGVSAKQRDDIIKRIGRRVEFKVRAIGATAFAKGTIRHKDHQTITLRCWHEVHMNREPATGGSVFLD